MAGTNVSVFGINYCAALTDGYLGLPVEALGTDYVVAGYKNGGVNTGLDGSEFAVVGTADDATVTITPSTDVGSHTRGVSHTIALERGQVYQLVDSRVGDDLTGTLISSTRPIAVFGGHMGANIPVGTPAANQSGRYGYSELARPQRIRYAPH